jgi:hypothetical protein
MPTRHAALILALTAALTATVGLLAFILLLRPDAALLLAAGAYLGCSWIWRRRYGIALTALALIIWHHYTRTNGDPK